MVKTYSRLPHDIYGDHLEVINGIRFTPREIDIIAFVLNGRSAKKTASFLSISPKTVENHTRNIMQKLGCSSRDGIIDFIEKSGSYSQLKEYYLSLLVESEFKLRLRELSGEIQPSGLQECFIIYLSQQDKPDAFISSFEEHLKLAGLRTSIYLYKEDEDKSYPSIKSENNKNSVIILIHSESRRGQMLSYKSLTTATEEEISRSLRVETDTKAQDLLDFKADYFHSFFRLLQQTSLFPNTARALADFDKKYSTLVSANPVATQAAHLLFNKKGSLFDFSTYLAHKKVWFIILGFVSALLLFLTFKNTWHEHEEPKNLHHVRSDLILPSKDTFLDRPLLNTQISQSFKNQAEDIKTIALVGIGGAEKSTLARHYASQQNAEVIWEINAESKAALFDSFEKLAFNLCATEEEKKQLRRLMEINYSPLKEEEVVNAVKRGLKTKQSWLLIFDNLESFKDAQKYFPFDSHNWGKGKILITTRDQTLRNSGHINDTIFVGELDPEERYLLFIKLLGKKEREQINKDGGNLKPYTAEKKLAVSFLNEIPPYPLDISIAAYYLKVTGISLDSYLKNLKEHKEDFEKNQENILKDVSQYTNTRYNIISFSLKHLLETDQEFAGLLLFISMISYQDIQRSLLDHFKDKLIVDGFIHHLNKYSLITPKYSSFTNANISLSIHRSTQEICLDYLKRTIDPKQREILIRDISIVLNKYIDAAINKADYGMVEDLVTHIEAFLQHTELLTDTNRGNIGGKLGSLYYYSGSYTKARSVLESSIAFLKPNERNHHEGIAYSSAYLGLIYKKSGEYDKAKDLLEKSIRLYKENLPENRLEYCWTLSQLGVIYADLNELEKAKDCINQSLEIYRKYFPKDLMGIACALAYLGNIYSQLGNYEDAQKSLELSLETYQKVLPEEHVDIGWTCVHLGDVYRILGKYDDAEKQLIMALEIYKKQFGEKHIDVAWVLGYLGNLYKSKGDLDKAKNLLERSLHEHEHYFGTDHFDVAKIANDLGQVYVAIGRFEKSKKLYMRALEIYRKDKKKNKTRISLVLSNLGEVYLLQDQLNNSEKYVLEALDIFQERTYPEGYKVFENASKLFFKKSKKQENTNQARLYKEQAITYHNQALAYARRYFPSRGSVSEKLDR